MKRTILICATIIALFAVAAMLYDSTYGDYEVMTTIRDLNAPVTTMHTTEAYYGTTTYSEPADRITTGEKNALLSAIGYLNFSPFSYNGLMRQLKYEGYTDSEATYGADNCGADWNEQAVINAVNYLGQHRTEKSCGK